MSGAVPQRGPDRGCLLLPGARPAPSPTGGPGLSGRDH